VRVVVSGASPLDPDLADDFRQSSGHVVEQGYGLTEASPVVAVTIGAGRTADGAPKPHSVGRPLPGIEVRIVEGGATGEGRDAGPDDPAEIWVRGDNLLTGYWPDGSDGPRADGWYATGDVGMLDADGELYLVDRLRELVIVSGFNVYPREVEDVVSEAYGVAQVAVVGLPHEETGEQVVAFVVPLPDVAESEVRESVAAISRTRLARFKQPTRIEVVARGLQPVRGRAVRRRGRRGRDRRHVRDGRHRPASGPRGPALRRGPGHVRRRPAARLLARRPCAAAKSARPLRGTGRCRERDDFVNEGARS
jgi:long-chain acyl-CoA synthetase